MKDKRRSAGEADSDMGGQEDGDPRLAALLAGAVRDDAVDPGAEEQVLAAFRQARDQGAHGAARTRRRDDWRPAGERRHGGRVRTTLVALAASATLGGVAVAAIGSGVVARPGGDGRDRPQPSSSAPADPGSGAVTPQPYAPGTTGGPGASAGTGSGGPAGSSDRPTAAQDTEAHCRAYDSVRKNGKALDSTAWQRLVRAAGGEDGVETYCAALLSGSEESNGSNGSKEKKEKKEKKKDTGDIKPSKSAKVSKSAGGKRAEKKAKSTKSAADGKSD